MSDIITLLPDSIANQIAAGEVIQRPASAVKELLENAVDAGATKIQLIIKDAGKTWIQVVDNGCGMSETDARMSFERHATSKIKSADDLFAIRTMGFRGEAMASIAAIAQVEMKTKLHGTNIGTAIIIEGSEVKSQEAVQCNEGTNFIIKNLFFNVPARRNFLKSNTVETRHIIEEFQRVALAYPQISFVLFNNGVEIFHLKEGNLRQRVVGVFGNSFNEKLVPVEENTTVTTIYGFIGKPDTARKLRGEQYLFVNNRFIKSHYLHHAIATAYDEMIAADSHPMYALYLDINPSRIDVNVHPTKQEIKFEDEKIIYTFVHTAVKHALGKYSITPTLDFTQETAFNRLDVFTQLSQTSAQHNQQEEILTTEQPKSFQSFGSHKSADAHQWKQLYDGLKNEKQATYTIPSRWDAEQEENVLLPNENIREEESPVFQIHNRFIVSQIKSGYILLDQQRAHERILYEKYLMHLSGVPNNTQPQLFPITWNLSIADVTLIAELLSEIKLLGFDLNHFGGNSFVLHGVPSEVLAGQEIQTLEKILDDFKQDEQALKHNRKEKIAVTMAKMNAIKAGKTLSEKECRSLLDQLFASENPYYTPEGNPTFITYHLRDLEKEFEKK